MNSVNVINNANIYMNGNNLVAQGAKVKLPEIEVTMEEVQTLGAIGKIKLPTGIGELTGEITWNSFYVDVFKTCYSPFENVQLMIRANNQKFDAQGRKQESPLSTLLNVTFTKNPLGEFEPQKNAQFTSTMHVHSVMQMEDGIETLFFDSFSNQFRVGGKDQLAKYRQNLGI